MLAVAVAVPGFVSAVSFEKSVTCAVYHRMEVGRLKSRGLDAMLGEKENLMNAWIDHAKAQADIEHGTKAEESFNTLWQEELQKMMDMINSNYSNTVKLRVYYQQPCNQAALTPDQQ